MRPRKARELIPAVAKESDISVKMAEDIVNFYWREVWSALTNLESIKVHVVNLGDFNIKHWLLDKTIENVSSTIDNHKFKGSVRYVVNSKLEDNLTLLKNLKEMLHNEQQRKDFIYEHKKNIKDDKEIQFPGTVEA